ncbi:MAG: hypothetical protein KAR06_03690 [Deltaproteobacteria bacterium]|nr:hypothetical protein [Deltaproteobacteria bacterium]
MEWIKKSLISLMWTIASITPLFLYMDYVLDFNLLALSAIEIFALGAFIGLNDAIHGIEDKYKK